jgi:hypothetical protein
VAIEWELLFSLWGRILGLNPGHTPTPFVCIQVLTLKIPNFAWIGLKVEIFLPQPPK